MISYDYRGYKIAKLSKMDWEIWAKQQSKNSELGGKLSIEVYFSGN